MVTEIHSWAVPTPITSQFAIPSGIRGRLAGRFMLWTNHQQHLLHALDVQPGERVLEVGYGPGGLLRLLSGTEAASIHGVDPSPAMRDLACRINREAVNAGRVHLALGDAESTGLPDESFDRAIAVNNVALWPDLDAGLAELDRVIRPGGRIVLAWHGGHHPNRLARRLRLPQDSLHTLGITLERRFPGFQHQQTTNQDIYIATKPSR